MIGRLSRPPGRHRAGQPHTSVHRRLWDGPARAEAERMERSHPAWLVLYSLGTRRFYALATWPASESVIVCDDTAAGLEEQMREKETALTWQAPPTPSPPSPGVFPPPSLARRGGIASPAPVAPSPRRAAVPRSSRRAA
ncbi:hypothetical protein AB0395_00480 [Streptosporangium sp. NPDC051023]|uniref:hypothetical protein n=1 Tax=Streptosporangium sp. NPDC051023 TaxID=3155410 RepID=UPI00344FCB04